MVKSIAASMSEPRSGDSLDLIRALKQFLSFLIFIFSLPFFVFIYLGGACEHAYVCMMDNLV